MTELIYGSLLLATDGSQEVQRATAHALSLARALQAKLYVLYVADTHTAQSLGVHYREGVQELEKEGKRIVDETVAQATAAGIDVEPILTTGRPGPRICQVAEEVGADMVIVGARGRSGLTEILMGSVSSYVADHAQAPVLVVRD